MNGVKRGLFSNEAGMGSAPNAAATANVSHPVKQGFVQLLGVFFDTLIVCSCTAFIIMLSKVETTGDLSGIEITQAAMTQHYGSWASIFLAFAIFTFAFSSIVGGYYYGEANLGFIHNSALALLIYHYVWCYSQPSKCLDFSRFIYGNYGSHKSYSYCDFREIFLCSFR